MDKDSIDVLARRAGLAKALAEFPDDVEAAAKLAAKIVEQLEDSADPTTELWPAMRAGTDR
jgi:hypothetical protein